MVDMSYDAKVAIILDSNDTEWIWGPVISWTCGQSMVITFGTSSEEKDAAHKDNLLDYWVAFILKVEVIIN